MSKIDIAKERVEYESKLSVRERLRFGSENPALAGQYVVASIQQEWEIWLGEAYRAARKEACVLGAA